jgi:hypothetical protein
VDAHSSLVLFGVGFGDLPFAADMRLPRFQFRLRTLMIVIAVAGIWAWGARQLLDNAMEGHRRWLQAKGLPDDPDFPTPDHLPIDVRVVALVMLLALTFGVLLIWRKRKNREEQ